MNEETKEITCIICPKGCKIEVKTEDSNVVEVIGNACPEGREYAIQEIISPSRIIMSVIKCKNCDIPTVSVKTSDPVPKNKIQEVMDDISKIEVEAPIEIGDIIYENVGKTETDLIATRNASKLRD